MSADLALSSLLEHPDNGSLTVVSGRETLWREVHVEATDADLPEPAAASLAVLTVAPPDAPWQIDALLRRVRDRGFTGVALTGGDFLGAGSLALAERIGLVVLRVERPTALAKACWELLEARDALTLSYVRKVAMSIEYHAEGLTDLLRHLAANLGHGVSLIDSQGVLQGVGDELPQSVLGATDFTRRIDIVRTDEGSAASVRIDSRSREGLRLVFHGRALGDAQLNALATAVEVAWPAVAARILIDEVDAVSDVSRSSGLLGDFLESRGQVDADLARRMLDRGWRTTGYHLGFRIVGRVRSDPLEMLRFLAHELGGFPIDSHATTRGGGVTGWLTFPHRPSPDDLEGYVTRLRALHTLAQSQTAVATGIGSLASGTAGLFETLSEANDAARLAINRAATGWFLHIDRLGLEQLLLAWTSNDTFVPAAQSLLAPLNGGELLRTLSAYLDNESGLSATAAALGLHRNTVWTRIQRVQELLGVDLHDPETRLALHLATRAVREAG
ncbi:helix-turn-helix domain-containing protein [Salinibacterium sp. ZJ454]|uniref:PucR family transcriptional regulator n=1 Tax=Salinibacterium sp. ZJ454 TaxID=2708339 RepID=UPI00141DE95D|nr:helix-turn-helix domain-containing protein [Salinibacterium sp. ZJ454]